MRRIAILAAVAAWALTAGCATGKVELPRVKYAVGDGTKGTNGTDRTDAGALAKGDYGKVR